MYEDAQLDDLIVLRLSFCTEAASNGRYRQKRLGPAVGLRG